MWAMWILAGMAAITGLVGVTNEIRNPLPSNATAGDLAVSMREYRLAVVNYVRAHPSASGTVSEDSLQFPPWYVKNPLWKNTVSGGAVTVYAASLPPQSITLEIVKMSGNSIYAGEAVASHTLYSPVYGQTSIALPAAIPNGAPVWISSAN
jgi:hypothetical protein